jgi:hypothetical protein
MFHDPAFWSINVFKMSAPYKGGEKQIFFQNCIKKMNYLRLNFIWSQALTHFIKWANFLFVLFQRHGLFLYQHRFINPTFSKYVLLDWTVNE